MTHTIERAPTGRAKCRACKRALVKDGLRLGEETPNAFGAGTAMHWYHLACGARQRPEAFISAWQSFALNCQDEGVLAEGAKLLQTAELGKVYYRLPRFVRAERAPSGRARCQGCRELIEKDALRFVLQRIEEGMPSGAGFVHVDCAHLYAGAVDEIIERVVDQSELDQESWSEVEASLARQAQFPREIKVPYRGGSGDDADEAEPGSGGNRDSDGGRS